VDVKIFIFTSKNVLAVVKKIAKHFSGLVLVAKYSHFLKHFCKYFRGKINIYTLLMLVAFLHLNTN